MARALNTSSITRGLSNGHPAGVRRSDASNRPERPGSQVQLDFSVSLKIIWASLNFSGVRTTRKNRVPENRRSRSGGLKPGVLIGGIIHHQLNQNLKVALVRRAEKGFEIVRRPVARMDTQVIGNIVAVVLEG